VYQYKRVACPLRDQGNSDYCLASSGRRDKDTGILGRKCGKRSSLNVRQRTLKGHRQWRACVALVVYCQRDSRLACKLSQLHQTAARQCNMMFGVFSKVDDARGASDWSPKRLSLVELGILKSREAPNSIDECGGQAGTLDEQSLRQNGGDLGRQGA
jgi:hypothetical protein